MPIKLSNTRNALNNGVKCLVYGDAGVGKTMLCATAPRPLIISAEGGMLSLANHSITTIELSTRDDLIEAYDWLTHSANARHYDTICLDSLSEIAEVLLADEKLLTKDPRQAYGVMNDEMATSIRAFRDLKEKNVYFTCKLKRIVDESSGAVSFIPSVPGQGLLQSLPYFFDEVFALRVEKDGEGNVQRALMCDSDGAWLAKDRSGKLDMWEAPDLGAIINKIGGKTE